jgi:acetyl esterase/lipase
MLMFRSLPNLSTREVIAKFCVENGQLDHIQNDMPYGGKLHWIGPKRKSGKILLFFHGGGYNMPAVGGHVAFAMKCAGSASASLAMLEYTLAPEGPFPTQLKQAVIALRYILASTPASKIILAGDSAGGHLAVGVLSHALHPANNIEPLELKEKLAGVCLISPFLSFNYAKDSYTVNGIYDYISLKATKRFNSTFKPFGLSDEDAINEPALSPLDAPDGWWKGLPTQRLMLTMGSWETFLDDNIAFGHRLKHEATPTTKIDIVTGSKEVHCAAILDQGFGVKNGDTSEAVLAWMRSSNTN